MNPHREEVISVFRRPTLDDRGSTQAQLLRVRCSWIESTTLAHPPPLARAGIARPNGRSSERPMGGGSRGPTRLSNTPSLASLIRARPPLSSPKGRTPSFWRAMGETVVRSARAPKSKRLQQRRPRHWFRVLYTCRTNPNDRRASRACRRQKYRAALASAPGNARRFSGEWPWNWRMGGGDPQAQGGPRALRCRAQLCASGFRRWRDRSDAAHRSSRASVAQWTGVDLRRFCIRRRDRRDWLHLFTGDPVRDGVSCGNDERRHGRRHERQCKRRRTPLGQAAHVLVSRRVQLRGRGGRIVGRLAW